MVSESRVVKRNRAVNKRVAAFWITGIGLTFAYALARGWTWRGSVELHTLMESMATMLAFMVGAMALVRYYTKKETIFLLVGAGFVGTACLDGFHAVVTSHFFKPYMPSDLPSLIPWSWIASRQFLSLLMFLSWLAWLHEERLGKRISERSVYIFMTVFTLASFLFFTFIPLPRAYYPEYVFHRPEEFLPALFFGLALVGYLQKGKWRTDHFEHWLVLSLIFGFIGQAVFMSYSGSLFDLEFDAAHTLKKASYLCVLTGLLISMYFVFHQEERSKNALAATNTQLAEADQAAEREIARRKGLENILRIQEKALVRSNEELETFAYVASHDLQEPLRKVQTFGDRLQTKYGSVLGEQGRDYVARMQDATARMKTLINDLLAFSRASSGEGHFVPVDLAQVLQRVASDLQTRIEETGAKLKIAELPTIDADPLQMRQLVQNLIGNALKYRRGDVPPVISVESEIVDNGNHDLNGFPVKLCRLLVKDNGIGFEEKHAERIFEVFQRLHGHNEYEGSGIGLAICRKICERHGGGITAMGRPGDGATFVANLPITHSDRGLAT